MLLFKTILFLFFVSYSLLYAKQVEISNNNTVLEKSKNEIITEFYFNSTDKPVIEIYITPSCLHCADFLINDFQKFINNSKEECYLKVILLPVAAKDFFIMKLIQNYINKNYKTLGLNEKAKEYYKIFLNYLIRVISTIKTVNPNEDQIKSYKGSNTDPEMIKFQVIAHDFQFTDEEIINSFPNMDDVYERNLTQHYKETSQKLEKITSKKAFDLPLIIHNGKIYKNLKEALNDCNKINKNKS